MTFGEGFMKTKFIRLGMTRVVHASFCVLLAGFNLDTVEIFEGHSDHDRVFRLKP